MKYFAVLLGSIILLLSGFIGIVRLTEPEDVFVAWADHGQHQGLSRISMDDGVQKHFENRLLPYDPGFTPSPDGSWLYFSRFYQGNSDVYRVRTIDGHVQNLTHSETLEWFFTLTPDGKWVYFWLHGDQTSQLKRMNVETREIISLDDYPYGHGVIFDIPSWSPNNEWAFYMTSDTLQLYSIDGHLTVIPFFRFEGSSAEAWTPDGNGLIYYTFRNYDVLIFDLYHMELTTGIITQLTDTITPDQFQTLSPNGKWMYFSSTDNDGSGQLYRMQMGDDNAEMLIEFRNDSQVLGWSPDGEWLYFRNVDADFENHLYRIQADGSNAEPLADDLGYPVDIDWSPDGEWLYVGIQQDVFIPAMNLYRMQADGEDIQLIADGVWHEPIWSSDEEWLLFSHHVSSNRELFRMRPDGSARRRLTYTNGVTVDYAFQIWLTIDHMTWKPIWLGFIGFGIVGLGFGSKRLTKLF